MSEQKFNINDEVSILAMAADLDKSIDPFARAMGRSMRAMLPSVMTHSKSETRNYWNTPTGIELSMRSTARTIGIAVYLLAVAASRGQPALVSKFMEAIMRDVDDAAAEQRRQMKIVQAPTIFDPNKVNGN